MIRKRFLVLSLLFITFIFFITPAVCSSESDEIVRGLIKSVDDAWVSTDLNARIIKISKREGESFKKGDVLISFDCLQFVEKLNSAKADKEFEKAALENATHLDKRKAIGKFDLQQAQFKFEKAHAEVEALKAHMRDCTIIAPFNGRVAELKNNIFETINPGQPFLRIVGTEILELELIIPSHFLQWIKIGMNFKVLIDEIGTEHEAVVKRVGAVVDSASQTSKIIGQFYKATPEMLSGMSLTADFKNSVQ